DMAARWSGALLPLGRSPPDRSASASRARGDDRRAVRAVPHSARCTDRRPHLVRALVRWPALPREPRGAGPRPPADVRDAGRRQLAVYCQRDAMTKAARPDLVPTGLKGESHDRAPKLQARALLVGRADPRRAAHAASGLRAGAQLVRFLR